MSSLNKLMVQGIRSFGPKDEDKQILKFYSPLTLILGQNGSGKTTIIECLKYVTSGDTPPGSNRGQSFVCDPKMVNEPIVRAQVKLQFTDVKGKEVIVTRSIEATQKATRIAIQTLDTTVTRRGFDGNPVSISSKCADVDGDVCLSLGVSKAILSNVIFCHQEESNWPLDEGKKVKEKFDAIFAATKYIKCLEKIKEVRLSLKKEVDIYSKELIYIEEFKKEAKDLEMKLKIAEVDLESQRQSMKSILHSINPIKEELESIVQKEQEATKIRNELTQIQTVIKENEKRQESLKNKMKNFFQGSAENLEKVIEEFKASIIEKEEHLFRISSDSKSLTCEVDKLNSDINTNLLKLGNLENEKTVFEEKQILLKETSEHIKTNILSLSTEDLSVDEVAKAGAAVIEESSVKVLQMQNKFKKMERESIQALENAKSAVMYKQKELDTVREEISKTEKVLIDTESKLASFDVSFSSITELDDRLHVLEGEMEHYKTNVNKENLENEKCALERKQEDIEGLLSRLDNELKILHEEGENKAKIAFLQKEKTMKEDSLCKQLSKHAKTLEHFLQYVPKQNFCSEIDKYVLRSKDKITSLNLELMHKQSNLDELRITKKHVIEELRKSEKDLSDLKHRIAQVCKGVDLMECIKQSQDILAIQQEKLCESKGSLQLYKSYINDLMKQQCCPLCSRSFPEQRQSEDLKHLLESHIKLIPEAVKGIEKELNEEQMRYESLLQLKSVAVEISKLESLIPTYQNELQSLEEQISIFDADTLSKRETLSVLQIDEQIAHSIQGEMAMCDQLQHDIKKLDKNIHLCAAECSGEISSSFDSVISQKESAKTELEMLKIQIKSLNHKIQSYNEKLQRTTTTINNLKEEKINLLHSLQKVDQLKTKQKETNEHLLVLKKKLLDSESELIPLQKNLGEINEGQSVLIQSNKQILEKEQSSLDKKRQMFSSFMDLKCSIDTFLLSGKIDALNDLKETIECTVAELQEVRSNHKRLSDEIHQTQKDLSCKQIDLRELQDNLELLEQQNATSDLSNRVLCLNKTLSLIDFDNLKETRCKLEKQQWNLSKQQYVLEGSIEEKKNYIHEVQQKLQQDIFKNAETNFMKKLVDKSTTSFAIDDLDKYYIALDWAIMQFHHDKMKQINQIIRELWKLTYRGNDIDYVEIKTEENSISGGADKRKNYNYRVVMVRNGSEMDMRGRCSAGQKVLASLIIRIALAETFAVNCSVLGLDEPTTNLDRENIESLSLALLDIVQRRPVSRMQLIVITHDEEFLDRLSHADYIDYYYVVSRNDQGFSFIKRVVNNH